MTVFPSMPAATVILSVKVDGGRETDAAALGWTPNSLPPSPRMDFNPRAAFPPFAGTSEENDHETKTRGHGEGDESGVESPHTHMPKMKLPVSSSTQLRKVDNDASKTTRDEVVGYSRF